MSNISLNIKGYEYVFEIENNLRHNLLILASSGGNLDIDIIFGSNRFDSLRNKIKNKSESLDTIDVVVQKLWKEFQRSSKGGTDLFHPIFYLTLDEILSTFRGQRVKEILYSYFDSNRVEILFRSIERVLHIRNDIAHNRPIDAEKLDTLHDTLKIVEKTFLEKYKFESFHHFENHKKIISLIQDLRNLMVNNFDVSKESIQKVKSTLSIIKKSFWINLFLPEVFKNVCKTLNEIERYLGLFEIPGGVLQQNNTLQQIVSLLDEIIIYYAKPNWE